jgi:hypothetical protein
LVVAVSNESHVGATEVQRELTVDDAGAKIEVSRMEHTVEIVLLR